MPISKTTFDRLQIVLDGILIKRVQVLRWGACVELECAYASYDPEAHRLFRLTFEQCRNISYASFTEEEMTQADLEMADVYGMDLGESDYQASAVIHTDIFEISVDYRSMNVHWYD